VRGFPGRSQSGRWQSVVSAIAFSPGQDIVVRA